VKTMQLFIGGKWIDATSHTALYSPYSGDKLADVPSASAEEVKSAIEAAYRARSAMADMPAHRRSAILGKLVELLIARKDEAAELVAKEASKPLSAARAEIKRTIDTYRCAAEEAKRIGGETLPLDAVAEGEGRFAYTVREPIGVVAAITPFNFPMNLVAHKVGPALVAGNTVVLKPASQTPLSAYFIAELLQQAGLPDGALNVVTGSGRTVGDVLVDDHRIAMITFTGSPAVGIGIRNRAGLKKVTLELGSNSAVIVDRDADLAPIIPRCVGGAFANSGQVCISLQRIYVHEALYETFVAQFAAATDKLQVGDPLDPATDVSAMISRAEAERAAAWVREAVEAGARIGAGGTLEGSVLRPTVLLDTDPSQKVSCQEVFGPVVLIDKIASIDEGIARVNDSRFGLQAGIYTNDLQTAMKAARKLEVGGVMINDIPTFRVDHMPYGGVKESGTGREGIKYALEEMTELKLVVIKMQ